MRQRAAERRGREADGTKRTLTQMEGGGRGRGRGTFSHRNSHHRAPRSLEGNQGSLCARSGATVYLKKKAVFPKAARDVCGASLGQSKGSTVT